MTVLIYFQPYSSHLTFYDYRSRQVDDRYQKCSYQPVVSAIADHHRYRGHAVVFICYTHSAAEMLYHKDNLPALRAFPADLQPKAPLCRMIFNNCQTRCALCLSAQPSNTFSKIPLSFLCLKLQSLIVNLTNLGQREVIHEEVLYRPVHCRQMLLTIGSQHSFQVWFVAVFFLMLNTSKM